jgi:hypothetical protein
MLPPAGSRVFRLKTREQTALLSLSAKEISATRSFFFERRADAPKPTTEPPETPKHHSHSTAREVVPPFKYAKMMENGRGSPIIPARQ